MKKITFLFLLLIAFSSSAQDYSALVNTYLEDNLTSLRLVESDIQDVAISHQAYSKSMDATIVTISQQYQGIPIFNAVGTLAIKNNNVVHAGIDFIANINEKVNTTSATITPKQAISDAASHFRLGSTTNLTQVNNDSDTFLFRDTTISTYDIPAQLIFQPYQEELRLAWEISLDVPTGAHYYRTSVDAVNSQILDVIDLVISCQIDAMPHNHRAHSQSVLFQNKAANTTTSNVLGGELGYNVFPMPFTSPDETEPQFVGEEVINTDASPFGWHDIDGAEGAEFTITRGNNVHAYEDLDGNNNTVGASPDGGVDLVFNYDYNLPGDPATFTDAATVNLFYWNNILHDVLYQYEFDEASGNFQQNNYGNGGVGGDFVSAQAQDASGLNNANFLPPQDGIPGRMQMYLWSAPGEVLANLFTVNEGPLAGGYLAFDSNFDGTALPTDTPITAPLVLIEDDNTSAESEDTNDGCDDITNAAALNGNIAVIRRGACNFTVKVAAAEAAGALGVVVVNNQPTDPFEMGGDGAGIGIPAVMIYATEGEALISALLNGENLTGTLFDDGSSEDNFQRDGDLDATVIAHEYGHGLSVRLTGGPNNSFCLRACVETDAAGNCIQFTEQMGEGWSDWLGLMLTMKSEDTAEQLRGIGAYDRGQGVFGLGLRTNHYTTDDAFNDFTYATTNSPSQSAPHGVGSVWATMLWDLTWAYIDEYGFDEDIYNGTGGNNQVMQLVIDAMKLQICQPGFVDGRNAILAADEISTGGMNRCLIWETFAARGLGKDADQGSRFERFDQTENFDVPEGPDCTFLSVEESNIIENNFKVYPNPTNGTFNIKTAVSLGDVTIHIYDLNGREVYTEATELDSLVTITPNGLQTGVYLLKIQSNAYTHTTKLIVE